MMIKYITQIIICALVFVVSINYSFGQPGEDIADTPKDIGIDDVTITPRCVKADVEITYENGLENTSANVMDLNCPDNTNINIFADFDWTRYCFSAVCDFYFQLYICGVPVKRIDIDKNQSGLDISFNVGKDLFDQFIEQSDLKAKNCDVELRLMSSCIGLPGAFVSGVFKTPIQIINSANIATSYYYVNKIVGHYDGPNNTVTGIKACCCKSEISQCEKSNLIVRIEDINERYTQTQSQTTTKNTISINAGLKGSVSASSGKFLNGSAEMSGQYNGSISWENSTTDGIKGTFKVTAVNNWELEPYPGSCVTPEFYIIFEKWERQKWEADCINGDVKIATLSSWDQPEILDGQLKLYFGGQEEVPGCGRGRNISTNTTIKIITSVNRNSCTGSLLLGAINTDLDQQSTQVWWTNENGEVFKELSLTNVPYGKYTIHMEDQCCNYFTETRVLCPNMSNGNWYKKNDQFCKDISCGPDCSFTECVTPDRIEDVFDQNQKKCVKEYYYNNELLGTTSVDATFETEWDDIFEECVTTYYCNGEEVYEDEYEPEDSEWIYDDFWEECQRTVNCRGEIFTNASQTEGIIEWAWDDFWEECVSTSIDCNGNEATNQISVDPSYIEDWTWSNSECIRSIICLQNGDVFDQNIPSSFENTGDHGSCGENYVIYLYCDGHLIEEICGTSEEFPFSSNNTSSRSKNIIEIKVEYSNSSINVKLKKPLLSDSFIYISDVMGRTSKSQKLSAGLQDIKIGINDTTTGLYFINIVSEGKILSSKRVFIQN